MSASLTRPQRRLLRHLAGQRGGSASNVSCAQAVYGSSNRSVGRAVDRLVALGLVSVDFRRGARFRVSLTAEGYWRAQDSDATNRERGLP